MASPTDLSPSRRRAALRRDAGPGDFDPEPYREPLVAIIREIERLEKVDRSALDAILRLHPRDGRGFFSRAELIAGYRSFAPDESFSWGEEVFAARVQRRPVRSQSGVTPITVLTKPYPCPGRCVFCPSDVRMPKSYLSDEPGAQRATANRFDPYLQTWNRLAALRAIGHPTDKLELIVLGGTWSSYPEPYQRWFSKRCFDAMNDFGAGVDGRSEALLSVPDFDELEVEVDGRAAAPGAYNATVTRFLSDRLGGAWIPKSEEASWPELEAAQRANEEAVCRSVGFVIETRPDHVSAEEVVRVRRLGCTKVQLGYQTLSDEVLAKNRRGHDSEASRRATGLLRRAGFKIHAHWMPNLLGSTPADDIADFSQLFDDPGLCPDELKIYPCSLIESADLMRYYERGEWQPYNHAELLEVLTGVLGQVPRYCRVTRVIRDISSDDIVAGNKLTNFREIAERAIEERGGRCVDVRSREIKHESFDQEQLELREVVYPTLTAEERFLELSTPEDRLVAFLRLSLPEDAAAPTIEELAGSALVRELHVYGAALSIGRSAGREAQHRGLGGSLLEAAAKIASDRGYEGLSVISAIGTKPYYRRHGFVDGGLYQRRGLRA
jgi:elongator complex protein 3